MRSAGTSRHIIVYSVFHFVKVWLEFYCCFLHFRRFVTSKVPEQQELLLYEYRYRSFVFLRQHFGVVAERDEHISLRLRN